MKSIVMVWLLLLLVACGGGSNPHPEVVAAFKHYHDEIGLEMSDEQIACFAGIHQDLYGRQNAVRMFREPREWNSEVLASGNWERIQAKAEAASQRVIDECGLQ